MERRAISVGVIGAGAWGQNLVRTFHALGALGAVAEANPAAHPALAAQYPGVPLFGDYRPLLAAPVPAVAIATPAHSHYQIAREALLAGKDVFVEKPLCLTAAEAEELAALSRAQGRIAMVGHLLLFQPAIQWIRGYLDRGGLGQVHSLHQERLNLGRARSVENALWSLGVHDVAVLLYLVGEAPSQVEAVGQQILQPAVADDVYLHLRFPGGATGHLHTSWLWPERRRRLVVVGSAGMLTYDEIGQTVTLSRKWITADLQHHDGGSDVLFQGSGEPLRAEVEHFLAAVRSRSRSPWIDVAHGAAVVRVLEAGSRALGAAAGRSGENQKEVREDAGAAFGPDSTVPQPGRGSAGGGDRGAGEGPVHPGPERAGAGG